MRQPVRPCIERLPDGRGCPEYAVTGGSRCERHQSEAVATRKVSGGTTAAWRKARNAALERTGRMCEKCGRTQDEARADGTWLEVHHRDGRGVRAEQHDLDQLEVLCRTPCHTATWARRTRPDWRQAKEEQGVLARARAARRQ